MEGVIYDTAVIASIPNNLGYSYFPDQVKKVLSMQFTDGSWGANFYHPFDRLLTTSSVLYMMSELNLHEGAYQDQFERGLGWITENNNLIYNSKFPLPVGFEFLYTHFLSTIMAKIGGANVSFTKLEQSRQKKLELLGGYLYAVYNPLFYSMEGIVDRKEEAEQLATYLSKNGALAASPASSSVFLRYKVKSVLPKVMRYLRQDALQDNGLFYHFGDYTYFNIAYSLYPLVKSGYKFHSGVRKPIELLDKYWHKEGISFGYSFPVLDADDTAIALLVKNYLGIPGTREKLKALKYYEDETYFKTYFVENDPALLTNMHVLEVLLNMPDPDFEEGREKLIRFIKGIGKNVNSNSKYIGSPLIQQSSIILSSVPHLPDIGSFYCRRLEEGLRKQLHANERITTEEISHSLLALLFSRSHGIDVDDGLIHSLYVIVLSRVDNNGDFKRNFLWTSKVQYTPAEVDKSYTLSAIYLYQKTFDRISAKTPAYSKASITGSLFGD